MEITGNKFAREAFQELGIQKNAGIYEYESPSLQKYKSELANKVKELLEMEDLKSNKNTNSVINNASNISDNKIINQQNKELDLKINELKITNETKIEEKQEFPKFTDFKIEQKGDSSTVKKSETKISKTSKIKKVDFDFDFDSFNDINFSNFEKNNNNKNVDEISEKKEDPFACFDERNDEPQNANKYSGSYLSKESPVINEKIREEADKKFASKKAISYEDYADL
jgi:hypothetical protein